MNGNDWLAARFEAERSHLSGVAYRMLGSRSEAEDAVQEAWLRLSRSDVHGIDNLGGWLTTVVARVCLDMLRKRRARREEALDERTSTATGGGGNDLEDEAQLADSVGLALLVVLERLGPAERVAFVLHDVFDLSFDEIAPIVGRSPVAARQLASRARRRVRGATAIPDADLSGQRRLVDTYLAACRSGDFEGLIRILDPEVVLRIDPAVLPAGASTMVRGVRDVAGKALAYSGRAWFSRPALVDGTVGIVVAPHGKLLLAAKLAYAGGKITEIELIAEPSRLANLDLAVPKEE